MSSFSYRRRARAVIALIATRDREQLLLSRAIPSILAQTLPPDRLVIVLDRTENEMSEEALATFARRVRSRCGNLPVTVFRNRRTSQCAAGAWNSGIDHLHRDRDRLKAKSDRCFVTILDDDDAWEPDHIELCLEAAVAADLDMVAAGLIRHERPDDVGHRHAVPEALDAREQFIRGQHIQGSNLFVRLDMLLKAGLFDEHMPSCTDRDLCIRLADLPDLRFGRIERHTVHHYADPRPDRLSAPASAAKLDGLSRFWRKYSDRFDEAARRECAERANKLFGWVSPEPKVNTIIDVAPLAQPQRRVSLVAGFVTDAKPRGHVRGLLEDLLEIASNPGVTRLVVVVVENGPLPNEAPRPLHALASEFAAKGLEVRLITIEEQRRDWERGLLVDTPDPTRQRLPIAVSRTVLNAYVARTALEFPSAWAWILDDDKRLCVRVDCGHGTVVTRPSPDLAALCCLQDRGVDVVIGPDTDAAPLPFVATLRMQLLDLQHNMRIIEAMRPETEWPDRTISEEQDRRALRDSHYDFARSTEHLETPFTLKPMRECNTAGQMLRLVASRVDRLLAGEAVFRPLTVDAECLPVEKAKPSTQRGGSAIVFDPKVLLEYPHTLASIGDEFVRRSDMLVTQLMRDQMGLCIVMHPAASVCHDRRFTTSASLDDRVLREDVLGYALYRAVSEIIEQRTPESRRRPLLAWDPGEIKRAVKLARKYINERLAAVSLSGLRVVGLAEVIRSITRNLVSSGNAIEWSSERDAIERICGEMDRICGEFKPNAISAFADSIRSEVREQDIRNALQSMDGLINEYRATQGRSPEMDADWVTAREERARALLGKHYRFKEVRLLGAGGEGIVFTDDVNVYKVFDLLKERPKHDTLKTLVKYRDRPEQARRLYPLTRVEERDGTLVVVYPYEPSEPYAGGRGRELIELLRECKVKDIVCRNVHPKNLRVTPAGLRLVDYGLDIRPFSEAGFRSMAERAWLCWRWAHRPDLSELMRRALRDKSLPELDGFDRFWTALNDEHPSATEVVSAIVDPIVLEIPARRVLDYGCGKKGHSARRLSEAGLEVVGFDPGMDMSARWSTVGVVPESLTLTTDRVAALGRGPFDAVISSLVLCEMGNGFEYERALADIRVAVRDGGIALVTVCNPFGTFGGPTPLHRRRDLPAEVDYQDSFWYTENAEASVGRQEFHRPLWRIERDLLRHGLRVERRIESLTVDLDRFEPASDFMTLLCRPVGLKGPSCPASLLIKTCAMEAVTIERQVMHLVSQLEGPRAFHERVLAIDSLPDGFVRQHAPADLDELLRAAERLVKRGVVDRLIVGPGPGTEARRVLRDWFGLDSEGTHTADGAPLTTSLLGFEECVGDFILQVDSDLLIVRRDHGHDYLGEMMAAIEAMPSAIMASLNVPRAWPVAFTTGSEFGPWRVEVRGCLLHRQRLLAARPFPNDLEGTTPSLSWHRAMDEAAKDGRITSLRGGSNNFGFVHTPNELKRSLADWMLLLDLAEKGHCPREQMGKVDLVGGPLQWIPRNRTEPFVFVITGRNVPPGRAQRCVESLVAQRKTDWGAVLIDDGSSELHRMSLLHAIAPWHDSITLIQPRERCGQMANLVLAIRHICTNPESVIITLDLDDVLLDTAVLERVEAEYNRGADVTVGSMLRTDKHVEYPVTFDSPRRARGGNVWQHLRTFRKRLFDAIPDYDLRIDGQYAEIAVDWAFMIPIVEMAERPMWIREPLYLYEPSGLGKGADRADRESQIGAIVSKQPRPTRACGDQAHATRQGEAAQ